MKTPSRPLALALFLALPCAPAAARAAPPPAAVEADSHFQRGVELYGEADYRAALVEFRRAHALAPAYQVLYNIATASYQLQDYADALQTFERYLTDGGAQIAPKRRAEVEAELGKLRRRVGRLVISTSAPGAEITIDETRVGKTPLAQPILVSAGRRKVSALVGGRAVAAETIDIAGGDTVEVGLRIPEDPRPAPADPPPAALLGPTREATPKLAPATPRASSSSGAALVLPWVATSALTAGAIVTGVLALGASTNLEAKLDAFPGNPDEIRRAHSATAGFALATDVLTSAAVIAGGISLYLTIAGRGAPAEKATAALALRAQPGGLGLRGAF